MAKYSHDLETLMKKSVNYTSSEVQNELLHIMSTSVLKSVINDVKHSAYNYFSIMIDETSDVSNKEQAVICLR